MFSPFLWHPVENGCPRAAVANLSELTDHRLATAALSHHIKMSGPPEGDVLEKPVWRPHCYVEPLKDPPLSWSLLFVHFPQAPGMWGSSLRDDRPVMSDGNFVGSCVQTPSGTSPEPDSQQP